MQLHFDNEAMQSEVLKFISVGMPLEEAKRIMLESGFKCDDRYHGSRPNLRFSAVHGTQRLFTSDEIHVFLYHESGKITEIKTDCHTIGT